MFIYFSCTYMRRHDKPKLKPYINLVLRRRMTYFYFGHIAIFVMVSALIPVHSNDVQSYINNTLYNKCC